MAGYSIESPLDLRLPQSPETSDGELYAELAKIYNALRQIQIWATDQTGAIHRSADILSQLTPNDTVKLQNLNRVYVQAAEALSYGDIINYTMSGSILQARKANAASGVLRQAQGFCTEPTGIPIGIYGETQAAIGLCLGITGMTTGAPYYLSTSAGLITNLKPASPNLQQPVGFAINPSMLYFFAPPV